MAFCSLESVFAVCGPPEWLSNNTSARLTVIKDSVPFDVLRELENYEVYPGSISHSTDSTLQNKFDNRLPGELGVGAVFTLGLPRVVEEWVVAQDLADFLSVPSTTWRTPKGYFLVKEEISAKSFCFIGDTSLQTAPLLVKRYHNAVELWSVLQGQAEHTTDTNSLMFFGMRRTEIEPQYGTTDLGEDIAVKEISEFINNPDRHDTRAEIFRSVLSEFLRDQKPERAFAYLLRTSGLFAQRLSEGLAIYLSAHSPEKLTEEAVKKHFELAEKLEKVISGMEAKSLTIPAAVLLAVKEVKFGEGWVTLNTIILISAALYFAAMTIAHLSQRAMLGLLKTTIEKSTKDLQVQGLDDTNEVLAVSFKSLGNRQRNSAFGSWLMWGLSAVPLVAVIYATFLTSPPKPPAVTEPPMRIIPASGMKIDSRAAQCRSI